MVSLLSLIMKLPLLKNCFYDLPCLAGGVLLFESRTIRAKLDVVSMRARGMNVASGVNYSNSSPISSSSSSFRSILAKFVPSTELVSLLSKLSVLA